MTLNSKHTPGLWLQSRSFDGHQILFAHPASALTPIASVWVDSVGEEEAQANARLIAFAPELLEALHYYVSQHESHRREMPEHNPNDGKVWERTLSIAKAVLAKVERSAAL